MIIPVGATYRFAGRQLANKPRNSMESRATDQSHLNIETVSNVYLLRRELRKNKSCVNKQTGIISGDPTDVQTARIHGRVQFIHVRSEISHS